MSNWINASILSPCAICGGGNTGICACRLTSKGLERVCGTVSQENVSRGGHVYKRISANKISSFYQEVK